MSDPTLKEKLHATQSGLLKALYGAYKNIRLYDPAHPSAVEASKRMTDAMTDYFQNHFEFCVHNMEGIFIIDDDYFIEESLVFYDFLHPLELLGIGRMTFLPGLNEKELVEFCQAIQTSTAKNGQRVVFTSDHIKCYVLAEPEDVKKRKKSSLNLERARKVMSEWTDFAEKLYSKILEEQSLGGLDLAQSLDKIIDSLQQIPESYAQAISTEPVTRLHAQHGVRSMVLAIHLGLKVGIDGASLKSLALAALLHDIGRLLLPSDYSRNTKLTPDDADFIHLHTRDGASLLTGVQGLPFSAVRVALEHHIGYDGQGYPALVEAPKVHPFSPIVAIADFLSWGTISDEVYHHPAHMHRLIRSLLRRAGTQFDPLLVKLIIPFFGLYPPGTKLALSNGNTAVALEPCPGNILRPLTARAMNGSWDCVDLAGINPDSALYPLDVFRSVGFERDITPLIEIIPERTESL